jgi:nitrite reductase/ring-hydroxylating ferredoxin subunit
MKYLFIVFCFCFCLYSCTGDEAISRNYRCYFVFDTSLHPMPCHLTSIIGNPGQFCMVQSSMVNGLRHLKTTRNYDGATEDVSITTEKEKQVAFALGANNCIIIGTSSYDNRLVAYDGQCPNCLMDYNTVKYPLTWQKNGLQLHCAKCDRSYDINNGVVAAGDGGRLLLTYYAAFDGMLIRAWN